MTISARILTRVIVLGAGGHGREVASYISAIAARVGGVELAGFVDDLTPVGPVGSVSILGGFAELAAFLADRRGDMFQYITAVGDNAVRRQLVARVEGLGAPNMAVWTLRHPRAVIGNDVCVGEGTCLAPGSIVTTRVRLGRHCIVNTNASVSHDSVVEDWVNINPGAVVCGNTRLGEGSYIGAGATVIDGVTIGEWSIVGAGAVVTADVPAGVTAVGVPARVIKHHGTS